MTLKEEEGRIGLAGGKVAQSGSEAQKVDVTVLAPGMWGMPEPRCCVVPGKSLGTQTVVCAVSVQVMWPLGGGGGSYQMRT